MTEKSTGRLWVDGNVIHYASPPDESWSILLADLLVLGEYTSPLGPFLDDYFFVFVTHLGQSYGASFYSDGREAFLKILGSHLGECLGCKLVGSTDFASNVLWPKDIAGQPLYEFVKKPAKGIGTKFLRWFGFGDMDTTYSPRVSAKLGQ